MGQKELFRLRVGPGERNKSRRQSSLQSFSQYCKPRSSAAIAPAVERTLGKGEVACSNHAGSTIFSLFISMLRSYFVWLCICIYAGFDFLSTFNVMN